MDQIIVQILNGLDKGSAYALIALGLTLIFGTLGVVNFAHGALFMIGSFCAVTLNKFLSLEQIALSETETTAWGTPLEIRTPYAETWFGPEVGATIIDWSVPLAILVAIVYANMQLPVFVLLLFAMSLGMLVLKQFASMRNRLEALVDQRTEELRLKTQELEEQATHDKLTGLFNRRYVDDFLQREIENSKRYDRPFTIALADIDHFKRVNDSHSHAIGDKVLCRVAEILTNRCRKTDVVARYGGEEFLLCFPDTSAEFAEQICSQIRAAVERTNWSDIGLGIRLTISFGIAEVGIDTRRTSILSDADTRLYQAKHKGRNRIVSLPGGKL